MAKLTFTVLALLLAISCTTTNRINRISIGMTKDEVIDKMGEPDSIRNDGDGTEAFSYQLKRGDWNSPNGYWLEEYWIFFSQGKVKKYGRAGDWNSATSPTQNININVKQETKKTPESK